MECEESRKRTFAVLCLCEVIFCVYFVSSCSVSLVYRSVKPKEESRSVSGIVTERVRAKKTLLVQMEEKDDSVSREVSLAPSDDSSASGSSTHS